MIKGENVMGCKSFFLVFYLMAAISLFLSVCTGLR